jgi:SAM-dependent methyltransferase
MAALEEHPRYREDRRSRFYAAIRAELRPGIRILDLGSGRLPTIPREWLPPDASYVGLDVSRHELESAPAGGYDEVVVADIQADVPALHDSVDLAVSWQMLEHVRLMAPAVANVRAYLRDGGLFVATLSGGWSLFAIANRLVPHRIARAALHRLLGRDPATVFPAPYDSCTASALRRHLAGWSEVNVVPIYQGAMYFGFFQPLQALYLAFEDAIARGNHEDLATHYLVIARK